MLITFDYCLKQQAAGAERESRATKPAVGLGKLPETRFWKLGEVTGESVLFLDRGDGTAEAQLLFTPTEILTVQPSSLAETYTPETDYVWQPGQRTITIPARSRIPVHLPSDLRRPPKSQPYVLQHRDGGDEIRFGATHEYHDLQAVVTYRYADCDLLFPEPLAKSSLPRTRAKLVNDHQLQLVVFGDSISTGCNASGWADVEPRQPSYQRLVQRQLADTFAADVRLSELAVGGTGTGWGLEQIEQVVQVEPAPDLVILAFGMNDSGGVPVADYQSRIRQMMERVRAVHPNCEFILVATMLANPAWTTLRHELFPGYRDALAELCGPGVALADMTSIWQSLHARKPDHDLTGNGVNHPNDFGHRIYASQILAAIADALAKE